MWSRRDSIDYSLKRRNTLVGHFKGAVGFDKTELCDADPYLRLAAKYHGEKIERPCPICREAKMVLLHYAFGDQLGQYSGRIKSIIELNEMQSEYGEFRVYVVEVCMGCHWHHLIQSFKLGDGYLRKPPRRVRTLEDEDFIQR
ncbi:MAG: DUF5318 family protein [Actinomycetes bacterium]|jgi:hypothetical protein